LPFLFSTLKIGALIALKAPAVATITPLPSGKFRVQIRRKSLGRHEHLADTLEEAQAWANETEARLISRAVLEPLTAQGITFERASKLYQESPVHLDKAASTRRREVQCSVHAVAALGAKTLASISRATLQRYIDARSASLHPTTGKRTSGDTVRLERAYISAVFRYCLKRELASHNPANAELDLPACKERETRISFRDEARICLDAFAYSINHRRSNRNFYPFLQFLFATGMRPGETSRIEISWLNLDSLELSIPRRSHKNRTPRLVLITPPLVSMLQGQIEDAAKVGSPYLFWSIAHKTKAVVPYRYNRPWRIICDRLGISPDVVPHSARHEFISRLFEKTNLSDSQVAALAGDVHVLSLEPYKHLRINSLRSQYTDFRDIIVDINNKSYVNLGKEEAEAAAAGLEKSVNSTDLKSVAERFTGSSPVPRTKNDSKE
jgi:integrase